jgi:hypothetical protein
LTLNWPGHLEYDSIVQLGEGRFGVYAGLHPPVMSWLLGIGDALKPGAALFVVFDTVLIDGALLAFVLLERRVSWLAAPLAAACAAIPQVLIFPAVVWKDVLFAGSTTAGFACLAFAAVAWPRPARRYGLLAAALLLLTLGALARYGAALVLPFAAIAVGWIAVKAEGRRGWFHGLAFLGVSALVAAGGSAALNTRIRGPPPLRVQWEDLQIWDIVGAATLDPNVNLSVLRSKAPWADTLLRTDGVADYSPTQWDAVEPDLERIDAGGVGPEVIAAQWQDLILRQPLLYLRVRARAFDWVFLTPSPEDCVLVFTGVDNEPPAEMSRLGIVARDTPTDDALEQYALRFASTPVYSHAAYGALGLVLLAGLLRRRRPPDIAVAAMLASAMAYAASFAVISIGCDYRYLYDLDLAVIAAGLYAAATWKAKPDTTQRSAPTKREAAPTADAGNV